jgi:hypothetical protein
MTQNPMENKMVNNLPLLVIPAKAGIYAFGIIGFPPARE